jgi:hypothetical protein
MKKQAHQRAPVLCLNIRFIKLQSHPLQQYSLNLRQTLLTQSAPLV